MIADVTKSAAQAMDKSLANLANEFASIRTGRASGAMLERVMVDYYGTPTPIPQLAGIKSPDAHMLVVEPWDKSILSAVEKAIQASDLGITPSNDGSVIRLPFPPPTEERRKELVKQCRSIAEETRIAIRNIRRDGNSRLERLRKDGEISEDEMHRAETEMQKLTDTHVAQVDEALKRKEAEVMEV